MMMMPLPTGSSGPSGDSVSMVGKETSAMMGRPQDGIAFPAVLLAFASLGTPALGATPEADTAVAESETALMDGAAPTTEEGPNETGLSTAFALLAPTEDIVRRESGEPLAFEADAKGENAKDAPVVVERAIAVEEAPGSVASEAETDVPIAEAVADVGVAKAVGDDGAVALWSMADTVTLDSRLLRNLRGDFVARLERVAERMWNEHGQRVEVVEGYRTPQRQQQLFAQGRTTEGPVVTWTRNSLHSAGAAADLFVDGAPVTPETAALLARVAREEGLRTLHPFDSGHIQLEGVARRGSPESALPRELPGSPVGEPQPKGVAPVAPVAQPARPARPGGLVLPDLSGALSESPGPVVSESGGEGVRAAPKQSPAEVVRALLASAEGSPDRAAVADGPRAASKASASPATSGGSGHEGTATAGSKSAAPGLSEGVSSRAEGAARAASDAMNSETPTGRSPLVADAESGLSSLQPDRVGGGEAKTNSASRPPAPATDPSATMARFETGTGALYRRVHVPIEGLDGPASLQLGVRGGTVDAALTVSDPLLATELRENLTELRQSLASRGIQSAGMAIRVSPEGIRAASSTVDATTTAMSETGGSNASSDTRSGDSKHQSSRNGHSQLTDDHDDGPTSRRRDDKHRRNAQEQ